MRTRWTPAQLVACACTAVLAGACADDPAGPQQALQIEIDGRLERGSTVRLQLVHNGTEVSSGQIDWTFEPESALEFMGDGVANLRKAGSVEVAARSGTLTSSRRIEVSPPPSIAFDMVRDGNRDIYVAALDGRGLQQLTFHPLEDLEPTVEGQRIVFVSYREKRAILHALDQSSGTVTRLTSAQGSEFDPAFARGGQRLAFTRTDGGTPKLMLLELKTGLVERAAPTHGFSSAIEASPAWANSGETLAFVSTADGAASIFRLDLDGGAPSSLFSSGAGDFDPAWSPDGHQIAFASARTGDTELYVMDVAGSEPQRLTNREGSDGQPAWLADGRIVFTSWVDGVPELRWLDPRQPGDVHVIPTGGNGAQNPEPLP